MTVNQRGEYVAAMTPEQRRAVFNRGVPLAPPIPAPEAPHLVLRARMKVLCEMISDAEGLAADQATQLGAELRHWSRELERIELTVAAVADRVRPQ